MPTIYARADAPSAPVPPDANPVMSPAEALAIAGPGTEIRLLPGRFTKKVKIERLHGRTDAPVVIQGAGRETIIDGQVDPLANPADRKGIWPSKSRIIRKCFYTAWTHIGHRLILEFECSLTNGNFIKL
jgi:hypothetical protein